MEPLTLLAGTHVPPAGDRGHGCMCCCHATPPVVFAWADPKFTIFQVSSSKEEANDCSHSNVSDKEKICSIQNISGSFIALPLSPAVSQHPEKSHTQATSLSPLANSVRPSPAGCPAHLQQRQPAANLLESVQFFLQYKNWAECPLLIFYFLSLVHNNKNVEESRLFLGKKKKTKT